MRDPVLAHSLPLSHAHCHSQAIWLNRQVHGLRVGHTCVPVFTLLLACCVTLGRRRNLFEPRDPELLCLILSLPPLEPFSGFPQHLRVPFSFLGPAWRPCRLWSLLTSQTSSQNISFLPSFHSPAPLVNWETSVF